MGKQEPAGIYIIRCMANRACYVGKAKHLFPRLHQHRHKLMNGNHEIPLLQRDWDRFGQTQFEFSYLSLNPERLIAWEELTIMLTDALETEGGYNRMLGQKEWSLSVRIRKSERKLVKAGKFWRLPSIWPEERINKTYCDTFCQKYQPIANLHRCQPRHMRLPYVFWEISPAGNIVHPLFGLADDVWSATDGIGYDRLLKLYRNMVPIDSELDLADFSLHIGQVAAHHC